MKTAVVFDLDGTLVDSLADISLAANRMLADVDRDPLPQEVLRQFVGNGLFKLVERIMRHCDLPMDRHQELAQMAMDHYTAASVVNTVPYPGVPQALETLRDMGCVLGVCTNKPEAPARHVLDELDLLKFFDATLGGDTLPVRKPDPSHLSATFEALPVHGSQIFVGDSEVDAETARRAQMPFLLFTKGYRKSPVPEIPHTFSYDDAANLPALVSGIAQN